MVCPSYAGRWKAYCAVVVRDKDRELEILLTLSEHTSDAVWLHGGGDDYDMLFGDGIA